MALGKGPFANFQGRCVMNNKKERSFLGMVGYMLKCMLAFAVAIFVVYMVYELLQGVYLAYQYSMAEGSEKVALHRQIYGTK